jgi:hypothetical protein
MTLVHSIMSSWLLFIFIFISFNKFKAEEECVKEKKRLFKYDTVEIDEDKIASVPVPENELGGFFF